MQLKLVASAAVLAIAGLAACSDTTSEPQLRPKAVVVPSFSAPVGALGPTLVSDGSVKYCGALTTMMGLFSTGVATTSTTFPGPASGCAPLATDLTTPLIAYNPGWSSPVGGSKWIGVTVAGPTDYLKMNVPSNYYASLPGARSFKVDFNVASGVVPTLQLEIRADNDVLVYLNDQLIGRHTLIPNDIATNWLNSLLIDEKRVDNGQSAFVTGTNTLRLDVIGTRIRNVGGSSQPCVPGDPSGPPLNVQVAIGVTVGSNSATYNQNECRNPTGLSFKAQVYLAQPPQRVVAMFVIGDKEPHAVGDNAYFWGSQWWKNNTMTGITDNGIASFKGYAILSDNVCGGTWSTLPGNSSNPPETIPDDIAVIVTSNVFKNGPNISGNIKQIVMVHHDKNYKDDPGHPGNGPITTIVCSQ